MVITPIAQWCRSELTVVGNVVTWVCTNGLAVCLASWIATQPLSRSCVRTGETIPSYVLAVMHHFTSFAPKLQGDLLSISYDVIRFQ